MFILKKLLGNLLMPLSFSLMLLLIGLVLLWFSQQQGKKQFWGKVLVSLGAGILLITSIPYTSQYLITSLERVHPPLFAAPKNLDYVVVLGGGHRTDPYLPPPQQLSSASFYRLMEGIRLVRANPEAKLLLSGYAGSDPISNAHLYRVVARQYGVPKLSIKIFEKVRDTAEEAAVIAPIIRDHKSALVTSASHMPRALDLFRVQGAEPIPAPTFFLGKESQNPPYFYERLPGAGNLGSFTVAWHEIVGAFWQKIRKFGSD
jgi:uncharacterized SAM-binding protein YcdF (DUF218 family)